MRWAHNADAQYIGRSVFCHQLFFIDLQSKLEPDPNEQPVALLREILITRLVRSRVKPHTGLLIQEDLPTETVTASGLIYPSPLVALLAGFVTGSTITCGMRVVQLSSSAVGTIDENARELQTPLLLACGPR